jgi:hypothetical protein
MLKSVILSFLVCTSALRLSSKPEEASKENCNSRVKSVLKQYAVDNTVVFTGFNIQDDYEPMIKNYACGVKRAGLPLLVWSMSEKTHSMMEKLGYPDLYDTSYTEGFVKPFGKEYLNTTQSKPQMMKSVLNCGFDVLWLDADLGIANNPLPYFQAHKADMQISLNYPQDKANTGVVYVRNTPQGHVLLTEWVKHQADPCPHPPWCSDQEYFHDLIRSRCGWRIETNSFWKEGNKQYDLKCSFLDQHLTLDVLPPGKFGTGRTTDFADEVYTYHPNFSGMKDAVQHKMGMLQSHSFGGKKMWCLNGEQ